MNDYILPLRRNTGSLVLALITLPLLWLGAFPAFADIESDLNAAKNNLFDGRAYLKGFPDSRTRNQVRDAYLNVETNGASLGAGKLGVLQSAVDHAVSVRNQIGSESDPRSVLAQRIAWEAEEALLQGQLIAGNANLLKGLRVAFPDANGVGQTQRPGGEDTLPMGCPGPADPANAAPDGSYRGSRITDLCYARLHFFRGVISALDFAANDATGEIRASDPLNNPFIQYTKFGTPELPDVYFTNSQSQTMGYLLGNILDGYGKAVVGIGDRLWRAAYFDRERAPLGPRPQERQEMLEAAMREMQKGAHAQFLASLPLAATLGDGESSPIDEFQLCRVDQTRVTVANSAVLIDRIRRGEIPKLDSFSLNASTTEINHKIRFIKDTLKGDAERKYNAAQTAIWRVQNAESDMIDAAGVLRTQFSDSLAAATGIPPGGEADPPYFGLTTKQGRDKYRRDLYQRIDDALNAPSTSVLLTDGSELGQAVLQMQLAFADIDSARNRVVDIPQQISIEEKRVGAINGVILGTEGEVTAYRIGIGIAESISVTASATVVIYPDPSFQASASTTVNPGAIAAALLQNEIGRAEAINTIKINNIEAEATIRNLLLKEHQYTLELKSAAIQGQLAVAKINETLARIDRLVENHIYYQDSNAQKWWNDPAIIFEQEQAELDYENALREYKNELYKLSQMLASRWAEPYENPYQKVSGNSSVPEPLGDALYDDFTQPESVFNVVKAAEADNFLAALEAWDLILRNAARLGGDTPDLHYRISLRKDVFGFSEVTYDPLQDRFVYDPVAGANNIRLFRALLLRNAQPPFLLRLEFPLTFNQRLRSEEVGGDSGQPLVMPISQNDWNMRITDISAKLIGNNVAQSDDNHYRIELFQYGRIETAKYFPRNTVNKALLSYDLPLYFTHPAEGSASPYHYSLFAGLAGEPGRSLSVVDIEPTPYCNNYVLLIEPLENRYPIKLQNVEDIELTFTVRTGRPAISTGFAW